MKRACSVICAVMLLIAFVGATTERLTLSNIPLELDGSRVWCLFTAGYTVGSDYAKLTVTEKPTEPTEESTEPPTEAPTEAPTEEPTEPPTEAPTEEPTEASRETAPGRDFSDRNGSSRKDKDEEGGSNTVLIVLIAAVAAVAVAAIAGFTIIKLRTGGRKE